MCSKVSKVTNYFLWAPGDVYSRSEAIHSQVFYFQQKAAISCSITIIRRFGATGISNILKRNWCVTGTFVIGTKRKEQLLFKGNKFYRRGEVGGKVRWCCTRRWCNAVCYTLDNEIIKVKDTHTHVREIIIGIKGNEQLVYKGNKYYNRGEISGKIRWCCTRSRSVFFKASNGRTQMMYKNMKFYQQLEGKDRIRWRCTKRGCRAFYYTINEEIVRSQEIHNHNNNNTTKYIFDYSVRSFVKTTK
ncbi:jg8369 [Pararge aegeria aegeria]|uniref:Jg8369 protein n=1 Tax=Pararge aegeria aegeria TaxID=348720 RepID=A0A8S4SKR5_9NEOP|nr:jg8369 [Pararge aegeria aegeria]